MRPVYALAGGVSEFSKARPDKTFQAIVEEAHDDALDGLGLDFPTFYRRIDGSVASYFSDRFDRQLKAGTMVQDSRALPEAQSSRGRWRSRRRAIYALRKPGNRSLPATWISASLTAGRR